MKNPERDELVGWIKDVSKISGRETIIVTKQEKFFSAHLAEKLLLLTVIVALTFAASAAYYLATPQTPGSDGVMNGATMTQGLNAIAQEDVKETTTSQATTTVSSTTTTVQDVTTTTTEPTTTIPDTTTTTSTTTTTLMECGKDLQPPCETATGFECYPGMVEGSEGICHKTTCSKGAPSGNSADKCGAFALTFCDETN